MRRLLFVIKLLVSVLVAAAVLHHVGSEQVLGVFAEASPGPILVGVVVLVLSNAVAAARWCWIVEHSNANLRFLPALRLLFEALFFGQLLPGMVGGDAVRIVRASTTSTVPLGISFRSVIIDRTTGLLALNALAAAGLVALFIVGIRVRLEVLYTSSLMILLAIGGAATLIVIALYANEKWWAWVPKRLARVYDQAVMISSEFVRLNGTPRRFFALNGFGIAVHLLIVLSMFFLGLGLGIKSGLFGYFVAVPVSILVAILPISIAGWGVREAMMVTAFNMVGIASEPALAVSILFGAALAVLGLVGGALFLINSDRLRAIREAAEGAQASEAEVYGPDQGSLRPSPGMKRTN